MTAFLIGLATLAALWIVALGVLLALGKKAAAREVAMLLPNLVALFRGLAKDPRVPKREKRLLIVAAVWIASPIDLIPEFIPVLGPLDDAVVAGLVLRRILRVAGPEVISEHWRGDPATLDRALRILRVRKVGSAR